MTLSEAYKLARELMAEWECDGWQFQWMNSQKRHGEARIGRKGNFLRLGKQFVLLNPVDVVRNTILHEIAHIKAGLRNGHNAEWKRWCLRVGAKPERCSQPGEVVMRHTHEVICLCCETVVVRNFRKPSRDYSRFMCKACGPASRGKLVVRAAK